MRKTGFISGIITLVIFCQTVTAWSVQTGRIVAFGQHVVGGNLDKGFVTDTLYVGPSETYFTIQAAIDNASAGDTINVTAAYDSSIETFPIVIDKSLHIIGAQANVDPRPSQGIRHGGESFIDAKDESSAILEISAVSDVEINGFTIIGATGDMVKATGHANNLLFLYNVLYDDLDNIGDSAVQIKHSDGVIIEYNYVHHVFGEAFNLSWSKNAIIRYNEVHDIYSQKAAIYCSHATNIDIIDNLVYNVFNNDGITLGGSGDHSVGGIVLGNEVHNVAEDGITI